MSEVDFHTSVGSVKVNAHGKKSCSNEGGHNLGGSGGILPQKIANFLVSEMPFPGFFAEHVQ